jgi:hypothetical protein
VHKVGFHYKDLYVYIYIKSGFSVCNNGTEFLCVMCRVTDPSKRFALCSRLMLLLMEIVPICIPYSQDDDFTALKRNDEAD